MRTEKTKKSRAFSAVAVTILAVIIALTGTFAWQSISQNALNENTKEVNPGGRLHDDFNGTDKAVYAENFAKEDLIVRVQIREYMEVGQDAGKNKEAGDRKAESLDAGKNINHPEEWTIHKPGDTCQGKLHDYINLAMGGQKVYLPTFNKNKDSLKADINGTYAAQFKDYKTYTDAQAVTGDEIYDADTNDVDEQSPVEGTNITTVKGQTHNAKNTLNGTVKTMAQWEAEGKQLGDFWVYDEDGWAYWANPLKPDTATGLLLNKVEMKKKPNNNWYYGINVTGQFVTTDDLGKADNTGFYKDGKPSAKAEELLEKLKRPTEDKRPLDAELSQKVRAAEQTDTQGDTSKVVNIDNTDFYVLKVDQNEALLLAKNVEDQERKFNSNRDNHWNGSEMQSYLNGTWLNGKATLKRAVKEHTLYTRAEHTSLDTSNAVETKDKVFLLSEADVFGTVWIHTPTGEDVPTSDVKDYTLGKAEKILPENLKKGYTKADSGNAKWWWLRSPRNGQNNMGRVNVEGTVSGSIASDTYGSVRPALIVNLTPGA